MCTFMVCYANKMKYRKVRYEHEYFKRRKSLSWIW